MTTSTERQTHHDKANLIYEVNLYCELTYAENITAKERYERNLCDFNLIFLTHLDESASVDDYLMDAAERFPEDMAVFFAKHYGEIEGFDIESHDSLDEGLHQPDIDELLEIDNECSWSNWLEDVGGGGDDEDEEEE